MRFAFQRLVLGIGLILAACAVLLFLDLDHRHSMQQGANLGDRLILIHRGKILHDIRGAEKCRLRVEDLTALFEKVRWNEQLDESAAAFLQRAYI